MSQCAGTIQLDFTDASNCDIQSNKTQFMALLACCYDSFANEYDDIYNEFKNRLTDDVIRSAFVTSWNPVVCSGSNRVGGFTAGPILTWKCFDTEKELNGRL